MKSNLSVEQVIVVGDIIREHETLQVRVETAPKTVEQYARSMKAGAVFPPVTVYRVDGKLFLTDGFHRVAAAEAVAASREETVEWEPAEISALVIDGTMEEAIAAAAVANTANAKQMKPKEYRKSFRMLAKSGALKGMDARSIAAKMNHVVSHVTIWNWATKDFPGLLPSKPKKGDKSGVKPEPELDAMSAQLVGQRAILSGLEQALLALANRSITDEKMLDDIAQQAEWILEAAKELGGNPDRDPLQEPQL